MDCWSDLLKAHVLRFTSVDIANITLNLHALLFVCFWIGLLDTFREKQIPLILYHHYHHYLDHPHHIWEILRLSTTTPRNILVFTKWASQKNIDCALKNINVKFNEVLEELAVWSMDQSFSQTYLLNPYQLYFNIYFARFGPIHWLLIFFDMPTNIISFDSWKINNKFNCFSLWTLFIFSNCNFSCLLRQRNSTQHVGIET